MSNVNFNAAELSDMRQFYLAQLADAEKKVQHIRGIIAKLGGIDGTSEALAAVEAVAVAAPAAAAAEANTGAIRTAYVSFMPAEMQPKRGRGGSRPKERKSEWGTYIQNTIRQADRLMTANELLEHAMRRTKNQERGEDKVRLSINGPVSRMVKGNFRLRSIRIEGQRSPYYGLSGWFNVDGTLKADHANQFGNIKVVLKNEESEA